MNGGFVFHREVNADVRIQVGHPVYYTLPPSEELRMGRVSKIHEGRATVIRNGRREYVDVECCTVAKRELKNDIAG